MRVRERSSNTIWRLAREVRGTTNEVVICKTVPENRWFFATMSTQGFDCEAPVHDDHLRLVYAACVEAGSRTEVRAMRAGDVWVITFRAPLPSAEQRLLFALARLDDDEKKTYALRFRHLDLLRVSLAAIGFDIKDSR
jgi:hypothetical protein